MMQGADVIEARPPLLDRRQGDPSSTRPRPPAMRVALVSDQRGWGGGEVMYVDLVREAERVGHDVVCVVPPDSEIARHVSPTTMSRRQALLSADVIIIHDLESLRPTDLVLLAGRRVRLICHGSWQTSRKINTFLRLIGAEVWCVSSAVLAACVRAGGLSARQLHILPYGPAASHAPATPEARRAARDRLGLPHDAFVAAFVARMHPVKRPALFLDAVAASGAHGAMAISATFGTADERAAMGECQEALARSPKTRVTVDEPGTTVLDAADVLVSPSRNESLGVALLEALRRGLPVITTALDGPSDFLLHQRNCLWLPNAGAAELAAAIDQLRTEPKVYEYMRTFARPSVGGRSPAAALAALCPVPTPLGSDESPAAVPEGRQS